MRCTDIKEEALLSLKDKIKLFKAQTEKSSSSDFGNRCAQIMDQGVGYYEENARSYQMFKAVYEKIKKELSTGILSQLQICFDAQMQSLRHELIKGFESKLRKLFPKDAVVEDFYKQTEELRKTYLDQFSEKSKALVFAGSGWEETVGIHVADMQNTISTSLEN